MMVSTLAFVLARSSLAALLLLGYLGVGSLAALALARRGHALGLVATALLGWPLLVSLVFGEAPPPRRPALAGPFAGRITAGLISLRASLAEAHGESPLELASPGQLASLEHSLRHADERLAGIDRLIAELDAAATSASVEYERSRQASLASLRRARALAADELEQVLAMLLGVRVQIGLHALAGPAAVAPVRERLAELEARVAALAELSSFDSREQG